MAGKRPRSPNTRRHTERPAAVGGRGLERKAAGPQQEPASIDQSIERVTFLMDRAIRIPGTQIRFGLDPIIGFFFPEVGDVIGAVVSGYLVLASVRHGLPKGIIARMVFNVAVDYLVGSVPLLGDLFDLAWKANDKNLLLLKKHARGKARSFWSDWGWAIVLLSLFAAMVVGISILTLYWVREALRSPLWAY